MNLVNGEIVKKRPRSLARNMRMTECPDTMPDDHGLASTNLQNSLTYYAFLATRKAGPLLNSPWQGIRTRVQIGRLCYIKQMRRTATITTSKTFYQRCCCYRLQRFCPTMLKLLPAMLVPNNVKACVLPKIIDMPTLGFFFTAMPRNPRQHTPWPEGAANIQIVAALNLKLPPFAYLNRFTVIALQHKDIGTGFVLHSSFTQITVVSTRPSVSLHFISVSL